MSLENSFWIAANSTYSLNLLLRVHQCVIWHINHSHKTTWHPIWYQDICCFQMVMSKNPAPFCHPMVSIVLFLGIFIESSTQQTGWVSGKAIEEKIPCWGRPFYCGNVLPSLSFRVGNYNLKFSVVRVSMRISKYKTTGALQPLACFSLDSFWDSK